MRNLTVRVPDEVYDAARVYASRHRTSISSVVADFLFTLRNLSRDNQAHENKPISPGTKPSNLHSSEMKMA
jgi:plasmid stability protein